MLKGLTNATHADGLIYPKSGNSVPVSTVHSILHNRLYTGRRAISWTTSCLSPVALSYIVIIGIAVL
ncbi:MULTISPECIES: hypothetical protein [Phyllobacteriaceae]|uniref:hypothetical protein n=1 Tax=Phyllobacteriaceae TaxID=69277 RepID=UPI001FCC99D6|nr:MULTISPECIES: hypothetical protein [Mesorhizobium]